MAQSSYQSGSIVKEVQKLQNRRNPQLVMYLANQIRTDRLEQKPLCDEMIPNMRNGKIKDEALENVYQRMT